MAKVFHQLRSQFLNGNQISKYLLYAIGEIILVVIGILIALQVNTWNDQRTQRTKELTYLRNIKKDLSLTISQLNTYIEKRETQIKSANTVLEHFEGKPITNPELLFQDMVNVYEWKLFFQTNNTYQELINTGDFAILSSDSIKNALLDLETLYLIMKSEEVHFRFDSEVALFEPAYRTLDINKIGKSVLQTSLPSQKDLKIKAEEFKTTLSDLKQKNGFVMASLEFGIIKQQLEQMKANSEKLIQLIDREIN
ncbi:MAG: hypothetical protein JSS93_14770 [Bacteroidetes bacterium]|nr:hypothetical protein [Bacteroidota bacterium]